MSLDSPISLSALAQNHVYSSNTGWPQKEVRTTMIVNFIEHMSDDYQNCYIVFDIMVESLIHLSNKIDTMNISFG